MHNIDRNILESNFEAGPFETGEFAFEQYEGPLGHEFGETGQYEGSFSNEFAQEGEAWAGEGETFEVFQGEGIFNEAQEAELAAELLEITNEGELDQFLGKLVRKVGQFAKSPMGKALGGVLKGLAKKALPLAGTALGGMVGGPLGAKIGQGLASAAGNAIGLEGEFSQEDREFAGARQFVRIADQTARQMAMGTRGDPRTAAQRAMMRSVRMSAPGLLQGQSFGGYGPPAQEAGGYGGYGGSGGYGGGRQSGRWMRRGNRIVIVGV